MTSVHIKGDGVAANCCAHLLTRAGLHVTMERSRRAYVPAVMLSESALALIRDVFERPALFAGRPRIDRRIVAWGDAAPVSLPHSGIVISEQELLETLGASCAQPPAAAPAMTIRASKAHSNSAWRQFGARPSGVVPVRMRDADHLSACMIESFDDGWLFLIPMAMEKSWLLGVGSPIERLVAQSRLIAPHVELAGDASGDFDTCPGIAIDLCGEDWLACGTAAMAFDPICGDGVAQAVREAILASAVLTGMINGEDRAALLDHYETVLFAAMRRHLHLCADFYATGGKTPWWVRQREALLAGHRWCTDMLTEAVEPRFQLKGFALVARAVVT